MKFGMDLCDVRRNTLIESSVVDGIRATSTKLGATGLTVCGAGFASI